MELGQSSPYGLPLQLFRRQYLVVDLDNVVVA